MSAAYLGNAAFKAAELKTCSISPMILLMYWQIPDLDSLEFMPSFPAILPVRYGFRNRGCTLRCPANNVSA